MPLGELLKFTGGYRRRCGALDVFATWDYRVGQASAYVSAVRERGQR